MKRYLILVILTLFPSISWCASNYARVEILGLNPEMLAVVLPNVSFKNLNNEKDLMQAQNRDRIISLYQLGRQQINNSLESLGFYHPTLHSKLISNPDGYIAQYSVQTGPAVILQKIQVKITGPGKDNRELMLLVQSSPLKSGQPLNHSLYETFKHALLGRALQLGYLDAVLNLHEVKVDLQKNRAEITLWLETGKPYFFGEVKFADPPYPVEYLEKYIPFKRGSPYNTEQLFNFQKSLGDTDLFTKVRIDPELNDTENFAVPLKVRLTRKPYNKYQASLGFGTDTGARGYLGWERRRQDFPGHRINLNVRASKRINQANAQYTIPGKHPTTDKVSFGTQLTEEKPSDKKYSLRHETGVTHLQRRGRLEQILGLHYLSENYRKLPGDPIQHSHFLMPSVGYTWSTIQQKTLLQQGTRIAITARGGFQPLLSTASFLQGEARLKWITPLGESMRLILRGDVGATASKNSDKIPLSLRFFTGGDHTVRGYGYQSLGPRENDRNGKEVVVGGRYLLVGSIELEKRIYKNFGAAVFVDSGNAMNNWKTKLKTGAGVGIRYATPLGPLRLDLAQPLAKGKHRPRIHLTFGMDF